MTAERQSIPRRFARAAARSVTRLLGMPGHSAGPQRKRATAGRGPNRRQLLGGLSLLPFLGAAPSRASEPEPVEVDVMARPTRVVINASDSDEYWRLKRLDLDSAEVVARQAKMPVGKIGRLKLGRLISGSNLISFNMHARDLAYVKSLSRAYNTEERIFMTLKKCEEEGCNAIVLKDHNFQQFDLAKYWTEWGGKMVWLADVITTDIEQFERRVAAHLELGASSVYLWGGAADMWYHQGRPENIVRAYEIMRKYDVPVGIAAHRLEPIAFCEREGLKPDYYMKTLHHDRYWSAHPAGNRRYMEMYEAESPHHDQYHENMFCHDPEETVAFMQNVSVPWIAFKVLAAGAIPPEDGISYAFASGADFICLGMFDFQVKDDAQLICKGVAAAQGRRRAWC